MHLPRLPMLVYNLVRFTFLPGRILWRIIAVNVSAGTKKHRPPGPRSTPPQTHWPFNIFNKIRTIFTSFITHK